MDSRTLLKFKSAMARIYSPAISFDTLSDEASKSWSPADLTEGHKGRYLWTDGFGVINFLTLFKETQEQKYLNCANRLIESVHSILGFTRSGSSRLHPATADNPLLGGLRIGKLDEHGEDGDGQYFHYLTIWMFALLQTGLASKNNWYIDQARSLAKVIHPKFMSGRKSNRPRMYWKMSIDLSHPLVTSEGNLDPIDGYVVYSLLQNTSNSEPMLLSEEIADYEKIVRAKFDGYRSSDPLDLGMTLWTTSHWREETSQDKAWKDTLTSAAVNCLQQVVEEKKYFERPMQRRLAFREFGTILGIKSHPGIEAKFRGVVDSILSQWEGSFSSAEGSSLLISRLEAITFVMYATALWPGAFMNGYFQ